MAWKGYCKSFEFRVYDIHEIPPEDDENVVYVGAEDVLFQVDMEEDVSAWQNCKFVILNPDGTSDDWTATPNGVYLEYNIVATDLTKAGTYVCTPYGEE